MTGLDRIRTERAYQRAKGYDKEHDEMHRNRQLALCALYTLSLHVQLDVDLDSIFRHQPDWVTETAEEREVSYEQALSTAGALIAAELDRISDDPDPQRSDTDVYQDDVHDLLEALDLGTHARPVSPHMVVQEEVLPEVRRLREAVDRLRGTLANAIDTALKGDERYIGTGYVHKPTISKSKIERWKKALQEAEGSDDDHNTDHE